MPKREIIPNLLQPHGHVLVKRLHQVKRHRFGVWSCRYGTVRLISGYFEKYYLGKISQGFGGVIILKRKWENAADAEVYAQALVYRYRRLSHDGQKTGA